MSRYFDIHHTAGDVAEALDPRALDQAVSVWRVVVAALARGDSPLGRRADQ
jgi:hypothetical protein